MTGKDRFNAALNFEEPDRVGIADSPWETTVERWHKEGMPEGVSANDYFGYELATHTPDSSLRLPTEVVEETEEYIIERNADGAVLRNWKHAASTPEFIDVRIKTRADWEEVKERAVFTPDRVNVEGIRGGRAAADEKGRWFALCAAIGYDRTQIMVGTENLLIAMAMEPDWVAEMFLTWSRLFIDTGEYLLGEGLKFDGCFFSDDNGYRNTSLFSPAMYRELLLPAHKLVYDWAHSHGLKCILHSCGRVKELIPLYLEAGLDCLQPLEVKAGMDLIELKGLYGDRLAFMGGIDARKMAEADPGIIEEEISSKITVAKKGGGYIYHSDHSIPNNVSFQQYQHVMELVLKYGKY